MAVRARPRVALVLLALVLPLLLAGCAGGSRYGVVFTARCATFPAKELPVTQSGPAILEFEVRDPTVVEARWTLSVRHEGTLDRPRLLTWNLTAPDDSVREGDAVLAPGEGEAQADETFEWTDRPEASSRRAPSALEAKGLAQDKWRSWTGTGFYTLRVALASLDAAGEETDDIEDGRRFFASLAGAAERYEVELEKDATAADPTPCSIPSG